MGYVYLMERPGTVTYADIVDENIEPAEPFEAGRDHARRVGGIGDIARNDQPLAAEFAHEIESRLCPIRFEIEEGDARAFGGERSEEHTSELQSLMRISYAVFCLKKTTNSNYTTNRP